MIVHYHDYVMVEWGAHVEDGAAEAAVIGVGVEEYNGECEV